MKRILDKAMAGKLPSGRHYVPIGDGIVVMFSEDNIAHVNDDLAALMCATGRFEEAPDPSSVSAATGVVDVSTGIDRPAATECVGEEEVGRRRRKRESKIDG